MASEMSQLHRIEAIVILDLAIAQSLPILFIGFVGSV